MTGTRPSSPVRLPGVPPLWLAVLYALVVLGPVGAALWTLRGDLTLLRALAIAAGIGALAMLLAQFPSSGRFEALSGRIGIDRTMRWHQWAGRALLILLALHLALLAWPDALSDWRAPLRTLWALAGMALMRSGAVAAGLVLLVVLWAVWRHRVPIRYEAWRGAHGALSVAVITAATHHALAVGAASAQQPLRAVWWVLMVGALLTLAWIYAIKPLMLARRPWTVRAVRTVADRVFEIELEARKPQPFLAGQFAWVTFGAQPWPLADHPFSIASAPQELPRLRLLIKARGDFTSRVDRIAPGTRAFLDAPHGNFTPTTRSWQRLLLIAGGIGVAPMFSILREMAARGDTRPVTLIYGANKVEDFAARAELRRLADITRLDLQLFVDRPCADAGICERGAMLPAIAAAVREDTGGLLVMVCGPAAMPQAIEPVLLSAGVPRSAIVYERFDYD